MNLRKPLALALPVAVLLTVAVSGLAAQNVAVFPSDHMGPTAGTTLPGLYWQSTFPFSSGVARQMVLYESQDLTMPQGAMIQQLGFPRDEASTSTGIGVRLEIKMGTSALAASAMSTTFDQNYAAPGQVVFAPRVFMLPNLGPNAQEQVFVPLDTPWLFDRNQNLLVEYVVTANQAGNQRFNYVLDYASFRSPVRAFGAACASSASTLPQLASAPTVIGGAWDIAVAGGPASAPCNLFVGLAPLPVPFPLDSLGATGCFLHVDPLVSIGGATDVGGIASWRFLVPDRFPLARAHFFSQTVHLDFFANNLGLITSNGDDLQLGVLPRANILAVIGSATASTGTLYPNNGCISLFRWQ